MVYRGVNMHIVNLQAIKDSIYLSLPKIGSFLGKAVTVITANPIATVAIVVCVAAIVFAAVKYYNSIQNPNLPPQQDDSSEGLIELDSLEDARSVSDSFEDSIPALTKPTTPLSKSEASEGSESGEGSLSSISVKIALETLSITKDESEAIIDLDKPLYINVTEENVIVVSEEEIIVAEVVELKEELITSESAEVLASNELNGDCGLTKF